MRKLDLIVGIVGGVVLVAALTGAYLEGSTGVPGAGAFTVQWKKEPVAVGTFTGTAQTGLETTFPVTVANLTDLKFEVTLTAANGFISPNGDAVEITVTGPNNVTKTETGTLSTLGTVTIPVELALNTLPTVGTVDAGTADAALESLNVTTSTLNGTGDWTVTVRISRTLAQAGNAGVEIEATGQRYVATLATPASTPPVVR